MRLTLLLIFGKRSEYPMEINLPRCMDLSGAHLSHLFISNQYEETKGKGTQRTITRKNSKCCKRRDEKECVKINQIKKGDRERAAKYYVLKRKSKRKNLTGAKTVRVKRKKTGI